MAPKKFSQHTEGEWTGKALVHDKRSHKRAIVNMKIKAVDGDKLRMDVTSPVGTHMASLLLEGQKMQYIIVPEKKMVQSAATRDAVRDIMKVPLEPQILYNVLFDKPIAQKNWTCTSDDKGFVASCRELKTGMKIDWTVREGARRTISIDHGSASVQLNLYDFLPKINDPAKAFVLTVPSSFRVIKR